MLRRVLVGLLALVAVLGLAVALRIGWAGYGPPAGPATAEAQTRYLQRAVDQGAGAEMQQLFPEGDYFLRALTAMAEARTATPDLDVVRALRDSLDRPESVAVFGSGMVPEHGIFQAGWALAVAVDVARASGAPVDAEDARRRAVVVEAALRSSTSGFLEGYPGQYWPCDTVVAASALTAAAGLLDRPVWLDTVRAWRDRVQPHLDATTGLMPHRVDADGQPLEGPRGSSQSIIQAFWPAVGRALDGRVDPTAWEAFRRTFVVREAGLLGVREFPRGQDGAGDVDSGPLLLGVSVSASAVTLAAARAVGDTELAEDLGRQAELVGLPMRWGGERRYALGLLPVGDAFLAWARTRPLELVPQIGGDQTSLRPRWPMLAAPFPGPARSAHAGQPTSEAVRLTCQTGSVRDVVILGSTGSIGTQALQVVADQPGQFRVVALAAGGSNIPLLAQQALDTGAGLVALSRSTAVQDLLLALYAEASRRGWSSGDVRLPRIASGPDAAREAATVPCDVVLNGITGAAGLSATLATLATGRVLALANKESLVIGGPLVTRAAAPGQIVAVDSEHSALAQCLRGGERGEVDRLILTASGGPFRGRTREQMRDVTPAEALAHPTWAMGRVITTNSATLVNKGLELLEAHLLYGVDLDRVDVVVHPQSMVHSMVQFVDGSTLAQCSPPDMRLPIALGLSWPERLAAVAPACDWSTASTWTFEPLDSAAFPAVDLARQAGRLGGSAPAVYNAVNEECVEAFHAGEIGFLDIVDTVERVLAEHAGSRPSTADSQAGGRTGADVGSTLVAGDELTLDGVLAADAWARVRARELVSTQEHVH